LKPSEWEVEGTLGSGSRGKVFRARAPDGSQWAIKVLHPDVLRSIDTDHIKTTLAQLRDARHPAIPARAWITDFRGDVVVIHEYVESVDLETLATGGPIPRRAAFELCAIIAEALEAVRLTPDRVGDPLGIQHGDLKPSNVLIARDGHVNIVDFGMSKVRPNAAARTLTMFHDSRGFMSPERVDNQDSERSDLYSLGLILCYLLSGERPAQTSAHNERHEARREALVKSIADVVDENEDFILLMSRTLSYRPRDRPGLREFAQGCKQAARQQPDDSLDEWASRTVTAFSRSTDEVRFLDDGGRLSLAGKTPLHPGPRGRAPTPAPVPRKTRRQLSNRFWLPLIVLFALVAAAAVIGALAMAG